MTCQQTLVIKPKVFANSADSIVIITEEDDVMTNKKQESMNTGSQQPNRLDNKIKPACMDTGAFEDIAKQMAALKAIIFNTPETNHIKIQFIKEELSTGRYQIHSHHIAAKLLEFAPSMEEAEIA